MSFQGRFQPSVAFPKHNSEGLGTKITGFEHNFLESGLFSDEKLVALIENYPREHYVFTTMTAKGDKPEWFNGDFNNVSGEFILEAIKKGRFWLNLRRFDLNAPEYADLVNTGFVRMNKANSSFHTSRHHSSLLISSPGARVLYHADVPMVALWHVRGKKKIWIYDADNKEHLPDEVLESIVLRETEEEIPYNQAWDADAQEIALNPGQAVTWPHNAPHRVDNLEGLNVSITSEYFTPHSMKRYGVTYTNGLLRRKLQLLPQGIHTKGILPLAKCIVAGVVKKSKILQPKERDMLMQFKLDPDNVGKIIKIPKHEQVPLPIA